MRRRFDRLLVQAERQANRSRLNVLLTHEEPRTSPEAVLATPTGDVLIERASVAGTMIRVVDLFAGAGGLTYGAELAGGLVLAGVERSEIAVSTANKAGHNFHSMEVSELAEGDGGLEAPFLGVDLLIGGPPCQPFSNQGSRKGQYDPRDGFPVAFGVIDNLAPARVVLENVDGLLGPQYEAYREQILTDMRKRFKKAGIWQLNAKDYGVPQDRQRVFVWGAERELAPPKPTHGPGAPRPYVGVRDVLPHLGPAIITRNNTAKSRSTTLPSPTVTAKRTLYTAFKPNLVYRTGPSRYHDRDTGLDVPIPKTDRTLTPSETRVLMGFPPDYPFQGTLEDQAKQIGNAVPPGLAKAVVLAATDGWYARFMKPEEAHAFMKKRNPDGWFLDRSLFDAALLGVTNTLIRSRGKPVYVYGYNRLRDVCMQITEGYYRVDHRSGTEELTDEAWEGIFSEASEYANSLRHDRPRPDDYEIIGEGDFGLVENMGKPYVERVYGWGDLSPRSS